MPAEGWPQAGGCWGEEGIKSITDPSAQGAGLQVWVGAVPSLRRAPVCGYWCREMSEDHPGRSWAALARYSLDWGGERSEAGTGPHCHAQPCPAAQGQTLPAAAAAIAHPVGQGTQGLCHVLGEFSLPQVEATRMGTACLMASRPRMTASGWAAFPSSSFLMIRGGRVRAPHFSRDHHTPGSKGWVSPRALPPVPGLQALLQPSRKCPRTQLGPASSCCRLGSPIRCADPLPFLSLLPHPPSTPV